jgi:DNA-directed RNA polymerase subunit RPC12/RpoP
MCEFDKTCNQGNIGVKITEHPDYDQTCYSCPRCNKLFFVNTLTGEIVKGRCNTYACEYCGYRKARKLQNALKNYFQKFKYIRLWTFTVSSKLFENIPEADKFRALSEIWRRFLNNLRRDKRLSPVMQKVQYVKVLELQKSGNPHYHCFFDRWIPRAIINAIWESILEHFYNSGFLYSINDEIEDYYSDAPDVHIFNKFGNAYVEGAVSASTASDYISKYLMKTIKDLSAVIKARVWTKSSRVRLFPLKPLPSPWMLLLSAEKLLYLFSLRATSPENPPDLILFDSNITDLSNYIGNTS